MSTTTIKTGYCASPTASNRSPPINARLRAERDAALAMAFYAGRNLFGLDDVTIFKRLGESFRAWLDDDGLPERVRVSEAIRAEAEAAIGKGASDA